MARLSGLLPFLADYRRGSLQRQEREAKERELSEAQRYRSGQLQLAQDELRFRQKQAENRSALEEATARQGILSQAQGGGNIQDVLSAASNIYDTSGIGRQAPTMPQQTPFEAFAPDYSFDPTSLSMQPSPDMSYDERALSFPSQPERTSFEAWSGRGRVPTERTPGYGIRDMSQAQGRDIGLEAPSYEGIQDPTALVSPEQALDPFAGTGYSQEKKQYLQSQVDVAKQQTRQKNIAYIDKELTRITKGDKYNPKQFDKLKKQFEISVDPSGGNEYVDRINMVEQKLKQGKVGKKLTKLLSEELPYASISGRLESLKKEYPESTANIDATARLYRDVENVRSNKKRTDLRNTYVNRLSRETDEMLRQKIRNQLSLNEMDELNILLGSATDKEAVVREVASAHNITLTDAERTGLHKKIVDGLRVVNKHNQLELQELDMLDENQDPVWVQYKAQFPDATREEYELLIKELKGKK